MGRALVAPGIALLLMLAFLAALEWDKAHRQRRLSEPACCFSGKFNLAYPCREDPRTVGV